MSVATRWSGIEIESEEPAANIILYTTLQLMKAHVLEALTS